MNIAATTFGFDLNAIPTNYEADDEHDENETLADDEPDENDPLHFHEEEAILHQEIDDDYESEPLLSEEEEISSQATNDDDSEQDEVVELELLEPSNHMRNYKNMSNEKRKAIRDILLVKSLNGKLPRGVVPMVAARFSVSRSTIYRIWEQYKSSVNGDVSSRKIYCGRKRIEIDMTQLQELPLRKRRTLKALSCSLKISQTTLQRRVKSGSIRKHTNALKPDLKPDNKIERMRFSHSMLDQTSIPPPDLPTQTSIPPPLPTQTTIQYDPIFQGMYDVVHIDEKWFYMTKATESYYLALDEADPHRTCKSKHFIQKVMFLAALARPRFDARGNVIFSRKIGIFPLVTKEPARRSSVNRVAGTLETKPILSVNRDVIKKVLLEEVLPAIREKWPREDSRKPIFIQQDNARTHVLPNDAGFLKVAKQDGFDIRIRNQPPNSPDLNVLDLGYFNAIQALQHQEAPTKIDELVTAVVKSFYEYPPKKSNRIFITLQSSMVEIMRVKGCHRYKIPNMSKQRLERRGKLPIRLKCDAELEQEVAYYLGIRKRPDEQEQEVANQQEGDNQQEAT